MEKIIIGTRGSDLALWQANFIKAKLEKLVSLPINLKIIKTQGDKITNLSFEKMEGKGFFVKELEDALLKREVDLAVHSLKDLMTTMPNGLQLAAVGFREDSREALLIREESFDPDQPLFTKKGGIIGSSSVRRQCQIAAFSPDLQIKDLRGNVPTRLDKLRNKEYDAIIIAHAGIKRLELDLSGIELKLLDVDWFYPAPAQGILGIQTCTENLEINEIVKSLDDPIARMQTRIERGLLARFDGGCQLPLGVYSKIDGDDLTLDAVLGIRVGNLWTDLVRSSVTGNDPDKLVEEAFLELTQPR